MNLTEKDIEELTNDINACYEKPVPVIETKPVSIDILSIVLKFDNEGVISLDTQIPDPQAVRKAFETAQNGQGIWRVVDRLEACVKAIQKDWNILMT